MGLTSDYAKSKFEMAYAEGVKACENGAYATGKKKLIEAISLLEELILCDKENSETFKIRAEKIRRIVEKIPDEPRRAYNGIQGSSSTGAATPSEMGSDSVEDMSQYFTFYPVESLKFGFEGVIGLKEAKEAVTEYVINPILYPEAYNYSFISSKCILLEGPPGTGKTTFAKAVAKEVKQPFVLVNTSSLVNCYVGETGKIIDKVFNSLRKYVDKNGCSITIFFDEFDEIAKSRGSDDKASATAVPALLRNLDGMTENPKFLILANTNYADTIDAGILSRFRRRIHIPLPDKDTRKALFSMKLSQLEPQFLNALDIDALAEVTEGKSGRTITQICDDFLHLISGIKAGIKSSENINGEMLEIIKRAK